MIESLMKYWPVLVVTGSFITSWAAWSAKKQFVTHTVLEQVKTSLTSRVAQVEGQVKSLDKDLAIVKSRLDALPTKDDVHRLEAALSAVAGNLQAVAASQKGIERNLHLIIRSKLEDHPHD